jgi:hypothetical protein
VDIGKCHLLASQDPVAAILEELVLEKVDVGAERDEGGGPEGILVADGPVAAPELGAVVDEGLVADCF